MDKRKQPGITFNSIALKKLNFERNCEGGIKDLSGNLSLNITATKKISEDKKGLLIELKIETTHKSEDYPYSFDLEIEGIFSIKSPENFPDLEKFAEINASAILFPYAREVITNITTKSGCPPLILPPMNLIAMLKQPKTKEKSK